MARSLDRSVDAYSSRFLEGLEFSNSFLFEFDHRPSRPRDRLSVLRDLVAERRVIDFGCADHLPQIAAKVESGHWAHGVIRDSAAVCLGLDIDPEAVSAVNQTLGFDGATVFDIYNDAPLPQFSGEDWDCLVLGEVLEHIANPADLLGRLLTAFPDVETLILTVPNALRAQNFFNAFRHRERINSDHRYWFTPYTLAKVVRDGGWQLDNWQFCEAFSTGRLRRLRNLLLTFWPEFSSGLIATARRA